jgi:CDP-glucose 4,6-dehydratase
MVMQRQEFWRGRRVFITGHTGFKGGWLALWLSQLGAVVCGYALDPPSSPSLFETARVIDRLSDIRGDVCDLPAVEKSMRDFAPDVIFHLAAQSLVRESYRQPVLTYATNVMGTVHVLEAARRTESVRALVCVTSDKCYENREWSWGYREVDRLGGRDPYSSSKACCELICAAYRDSFCCGESRNVRKMGIATVRAGNVIGGGDWAADRLLPDVIRALVAGEPARIRHPKASRPWQYVLEPLRGYLSLAERLLERNGDFASAWNFGPSELDARPVEWIVREVLRRWPGSVAWQLDENSQVHEAQVLRLDCTKAHVSLIGGQ